MAVFKRGGVWWYKFYFAGQFIRESAKSTSKTVAKDAENQRRRELEQGLHNLRQRRENRIRQLRDVADDYLADYRLRFRGITFAEYAVVFPTMAEVERTMIVAAYERSNRNPLEAARMLGIGKTTVYRKLRAMGEAGLDRDRPIKLPWNR
jgi:DNA-binding NtrC family response regulator